MQKLHKSEIALLQPQELEEPLRTEVTYYINGNKSAAEMHYHSCVEIGYCVKGNGIFFINDRVVPFTQGCVTYMPSDIIHIAQSPDDSPSEWRFLFADLNTLNITHILQKGIVTSDQSCRYLFEMIVEALTQRKEEYAALYWHLMEALFIRLTHRTKDALPDNQTHNFYQIVPAINYISKHYEVEVCVQDLAKMCNMSESLFYKIFHTAINMSPIEYLNSVRISSAENLLKNSSKSITEISQDVGYTTLSSFYRQFRKTNNCSPRDYRIKLCIQPSSKDIS